MTSKPTDYVSIPIIEIPDADQKLMKDFRRDILQINLEESLHLPGMFTLVINNPYAPLDQETKTWQYDSIVQVGKRVKLGFTSSTTESTQAHTAYVIQGEITSIETHFTSRTQAPIIIRGYDVAHRLHRGHYIRSFQDYTDADIVKEIAKELGIEIGTLDPSGDKHEYIFQENQTNMEFLRERAARIGFELFVQDGKLYFRKPKQNEILKLQWLRDVSSFRVRITTAEQVKAVEVRSWDYERKEVIVARAPQQSPAPASNSSNLTGQTKVAVTNASDNLVITTTNHGRGSDYSQKFGSNPPEPKMIVVDKPTATLKEAEVMAKALFSELEGDFVCADAQAPGDPRIRPGKVIELEKMGRYSGQYYVTESRHLFYEGIYTTEFSVRGLRGGDLLQTLSPSVRPRPGQTHLVGIVTNNKDPKGWGRVRVKFPTLSPEKDSTAHASYWARVVGVGAGPGRGFDCLPEINDEVLVAFEHGDIHRPYVIGGVWNGKDQPPEKVENTVGDRSQVRLRTFKTRTGHTLQFVEETQHSSQAGIYITSSGGHQIEINDSDGSIEIQTQEGQRITLSDRSSNITIHSTGDINLTPGSGKVVVAGTILTGGVLLGTPLSSVNVGQTLTSLKEQLQQNTEGDRQRDRTAAELRQEIQNNAQADRQRDETLKALQNQVQPRTSPTQSQTASPANASTNPTSNQKSAPANPPATSSLTGRQVA
ncbi:VgrG-related protein [Microcoleus sp. OTE_8_concoct_300]|uniref:VgrG-related protein n=1 Tax=Microcoleus sp. OTE_8_concoct_300 TaxID=2964710 RepID=UPI00403F35C8